MNMNIPLVTFALFSVASSASVFMFSAVSDSGTLKNCGDPQHGFTLSWTPKVFRIGSSVTVNFDWTPAEDFSAGTVEFKVWIRDVPEPIYEGSQAFSCNDIAKYIPKHYCPLHKGQRILIKNQKVVLSPQFLLPDGEYKGRVSVTTKEGKPLICLEGWIQLVR